MLTDFGLDFDNDMINLTLNWNPVPLNEYSMRTNWEFQYLPEIPDLEEVSLDEDDQSLE